MTTLYLCTGRRAGGQDVCSFSTLDSNAALDHFEQTDHDVEPAAVETPDESCPICGQHVAQNVMHTAASAR